MKATTFIRCMSCRNEISQNKLSFTTDLQYPPADVRGIAQSGSRQNNMETNVLQKGVQRGPRGPKTTFSQVLKSSVEWETTARGWCNHCLRYLPISTRKTIHSVPAVLTLNTTITNEDHKAIWSTPGWLPEEIGIIVEQGQFFCYEGEDLKLHLQRGIHNITVYSLVGMVLNIESKQIQKPHLVAMVNGRPL